MRICCRVHHFIHSHFLGFDWTAAAFGWHTIQHNERLMRFCSDFYPVPMSTFDWKPNQWFQFTLHIVCISVCNKCSRLWNRCFNRSFSFEIICWFFFFVCICFSSEIQILPWTFNQRQWPFNFEITIEYR